MFDSPDSGVRVAGEKMGHVQYLSFTKYTSHHLDAQLLYRHLCCPWEIQVGNLQALFLPFSLHKLGHLGRILIRIALGAVSAKVAYTTHFRCTPSPGSISKGSTNYQASIITHIQSEQDTDYMQN